MKKCLFCCINNISHNLLNQRILTNFGIDNLDSFQDESFQEKFDSLFKNNANLKESSKQFYFEYLIRNRLSPIDTCFLASHDLDVIWLNSLAKNDIEIQKGLNAFFNECKEDPRPAILNLMEDFDCKIQILIFLVYFIDSLLISAKYLYKRILYRLLVSESNRLHKKDFTVWMLDTIFHRSLLCCALEICRSIFKVNINHLTYLV